jgi:hypothetical protein|tara:strand:- start:665 stop:1087 length:423 start_codon:yes stop_codon:yes gene_type:complete
MIKYILKCNKNHEFESWFSNSNEFENLKKKNLLECIYCKSQKIEKSIMSPRVLNSKKNDKVNLVNKKDLFKVKNELVKMRKFVEKNFEFVGNKFAQEVKEIYYDKKIKKNIYGTATSEEKEELLDEGIDLVTIPWVNKDN